jgi:thiol:disulfide interchange protein
MPRDTFEERFAMIARRMTKFFWSAALFTLLMMTAPLEARAGGDWNDAGVAWRPYADGLAEAKSENKPICLVFYTDWCPHCTNYAGVFHDPRVVEQSKSFVMIRVNKDENAEVSAKFAPDGEYIPRTYFLAPDGTLRPEITEARPSYKYFYNEKDPSSLLRGMATALEKPAAS